ncbi:MAG: hypothetical protein HC826_00560 [Rhodospirillales bacterium]|nr:hypothetical protein [Rhodospirillales bacterium]
MNTREDAVQEDMQALRNDLGQLRKDLAAMAGTLKEIGSEVGDDALNRVRATASKARTQADRAAARARAEAERAAESVSETIEERPPCQHSRRLCDRHGARCALRPPAIGG